MRGLSVQGIALFLFIPLVLFLFLRQPLGPGLSVAIGLAVMAGHRLVAAPWMSKFADVRCLWCGTVQVSVQVTVRAQGRTWGMNACSEAHAAKVTRFLRYLQKTRGLVAGGILLPLAWLLLASLASAAGWRLVPHDTVALVFRVVVATTVVSAATVPFARTGSREAPREPGPLACPVPLHNLFLLGIGNTLWVFRIVGAWWLVDGAWRLVR